MSETRAQLALLLLVDLVERCRAAQREYFRERTVPGLIMAKQLESEVDRTCRELREKLAHEET